MPESGDGAVRFRARNDIGYNGKCGIERVKTLNCLDDVIMASLRNASTAIDVNLTSMLFMLVKTRINKR